MILKVRVPTGMLKFLVLTLLSDHFPLDNPSLPHQPPGRGGRTNSDGDVSVAGDDDHLHFPLPSKVRMHAAYISHCCSSPGFRRDKILLHSSRPSLDGDDAAAGEVLDGDDASQARLPPLHQKRGDKYDPGPEAHSFTNP